MAINLESSSSLSRFKREKGINNGRADVESVPEYIIRCRYKNQIQACKQEIMDRLLQQEPKKYAWVIRTGFDTLVMHMGDKTFERFQQLVESNGLIKAYIDVLTIRH